MSYWLNNKTMIWEMSMLDTFLEHFLAICNVCDGGSWASQTLEEVNLTHQNYEGVGA